MAALGEPLGRGPRGSWRRLRRYGRGWSPLWRRAHLLAMALLPVEVLSGAVLYLPGLHSRWIAWLPLVEAIHVWGGVLFGLMLCLPLAVPIARRWVTVADWRATFRLVGGLTLTGLALLPTSGVPALIRGGAFGAHGLLALGLLGWIAYHAATRVGRALRSTAPPSAAAPVRAALRRRDLLGEAGRSVATAAAGTVGLGLLQGASTAIAQATPATGRSPGGPGPLPGFQLYTVTGTYPAYDPASWRLVVDGWVGQPLSLTLAELRDLPQVTETCDFRCVTGWEVRNVVWQGVRIATLLRQARTQPAANWIRFESFDGVYTDSLSLSQAAAAGVLLAHRADGHDLARQQGAPLRLVVPPMYGYKSVKWLSRLTLTETRTIGYWERRGYGPDAYIGRVDGWPAGARPKWF